MIRFILLVLGSLVLFGGSARALTQCDFNFEVNTESSALQSLIDGAQERGGFWLPIRQAPDDVQAMGRFIGRLDICLVTPDGKPRTIRIGGGSQEIPSPYVTTCTAALLPGNRLLANRHCYYEPALVKAGFTFVQEARINFGYVSEDFTDNVQTFHVSTRELAQDEGTDALVLQIVGADANQRLGGHVPMRMETRATPRRALIMIHHPRRQPQRFSAGTCQIDPTQADLPESAAQLRHSCETGGGSSGALLLDARSLAVVGLHNRGGLSARGGHNGGHKIAAVEAALDLGFKEVGAAEPKVDPEAGAQAALTAALLIRALDGRALALARVERDYAGTRAAALAAREQADLHEDRANAALDAAERLPDPLEQRAALEQVARDFAKTRAADRAQRMLVFLQPKGPTRDDQAMAKLLEALRAPDDAVQRALLKAIVNNFSGTSAATSAASMLAKMGTAEKPVSREEQASARLVDALRVQDDKVKRQKLETIRDAFAGTPAAVSAQAVLSLMPTPTPTKKTVRPSTSGNAEAKARSALSRALAMSNRDMRRRALETLQDRYPNTTAARQARVELGRSGARSDPKADAALSRALAMSNRDMRRRALETLQDRYPNTTAARQARVELAKFGARSEPKADAALSLLVPEKPVDPPALRGEKSIRLDGDELVFGELRFGFGSFVFVSEPGKTNMARGGRVHTANGVSLTSLKSLEALLRAQQGYGVETVGFAVGEPNRQWMTQVYVVPMPEPSSR